MRGQVSELPADAFAPPQVPVAGDGYVLPARDGISVVGATYEFDPAPEVGVRVEAQRITNGADALRALYEKYPQAIPDLKAYVVYVLARAQASVDAAQDASIQAQLHCMRAGVYGHLGRLQEAKALMDQTWATLRAAYLPLNQAMRRTVEFLDKGRPGMSSTFLTRLRLGPVLVDAKGVNRLYEGRVRRRDLVLLVGSALVAMVAVSIVSEPIHVFLRGITLSFRDLWYSVFGAL